MRNKRTVLLWKTLIWAVSLTQLTVHKPRLEYPNVHCFRYRTLMCALSLQVTQRIIPSRALLNNNGSTTTFASPSSSMDSLYSGSSRPHTSYRQTQPVTERIFRAIHHRLLLLHRSESNFFVLGATGNVYKVILSTSPSCTCPDRTTPCKHILFVLIRVLGVSLDDTCLRRRTLRPCLLSRLLRTPTSPDSFAGESVRRVFHELFFQPRPRRVAIEIQEGTVCPVCLDEMEKGERVAACGTCRNPIHEECLLKWKRSGRRRSVSCVICRARWRDIRADEDKYLNLSAYVSEGDGGVCGG